MHKKKVGLLKKPAQRNLVKLKPLDDDGLYLDGYIQIEFLIWPLMTRIPEQKCQKETCMDKSPQHSRP